MQVHYNLIEASGPDRSSAQLRLRPASTHLIPLETHLIAAPVELPCPDGVTGPQCSRQKAVQDVVDKYGAETAFVPAALLQICDKTLADYPLAVGNGKSITTSCDRAITSDQTIYGVAGHMHLRGQDISIVLDPGTAKQQTLLHIPAWVFHWQDVYYLVHPVKVGPGDTVRVTCRFDNSKADQPVIGTKQLTPRYVRLGRGHDRRDVPRDALRREGLDPASAHPCATTVEANGARLVSKVSDTFCALGYDRRSSGRCQTPPRPASRARAR